MRCLVERDQDTSDSTHALNERRFLYYGAGWQILEEHVDSNYNYDSNQSIERVSQNVWGLRYIDDLILRRVDGNNDGDYADAGDTSTDWEQYLNDHQFSVVAAINRVATVTFRMAYDSYGEARHSWAKDIDGDGDVDSTDGSIASTDGYQTHTYPTNLQEKMRQNEGPSISHGIIAAR